MRRYTEAPETMRDNIEALGRLFPDAGVEGKPGGDRMVQAVGSSEQLFLIFKSIQGYMEVSVHAFQ